MIQKQTNLNISDNSGVKRAQCIHIYKKKTAQIGDLILISVKQIINTKKLKLQINKGLLFKAIVIRTKFSYKTLVNNYIKFDENSIILLNKQNQPVGTRIFGPILIELRYQHKFKILSLGTLLI